MDKIMSAEQAVARFERASFQWGEADCACLVAAHARACGVEASELYELADTPRGDAKAARALLKTAGAATLAGVLSKRLPKIAPLAALPGDLAAVPAEPGGKRDPACGIVMGNTVAVMGARGIEFWPLGRAVKAWRV